jgi:hypothetical protein
MNMNSAFSELIEKLHSNVTIEPQYARILSDTSIVYAFIQRGFRNPLSGSVKCPTSESRKEKLTNSCAEMLTLQLGIYGIRVDTDKGNIILTYFPSQNELASIREFLETIPEEDGSFPDKGSTFFCYD